MQLSLVVRWFLSRKVRQGVDACKQVRKLVRAQRDLISNEAADKVLGAAQAARQTLASGSPAEIDQALQQLEAAVRSSLRAYPHPAWRENVEVLLVTGAIVLALRTFFLQPMAIPSGSAQPTLYGITQEPRLEVLAQRREAGSLQQGRGDPIVIPGFFRRVIDKCWSGTSYFHVVAREDGELSYASEPRLILPFLKMQEFQVGSQKYRIFGSSSFEDILKRGLGLAPASGIPRGLRFRKGDDIIRLKIVSGDHLFVNRMIYNFRPPIRGETIVFTSTGIPDLIQHTHYIKRLVALGGEQVQIGNDRHLRINGRRLDASTPGFENVYSFDPDEPPRESRYSGHVNGFIASQFLPHVSIAARFPRESSVFTVRPDHYLVMGDNTMNSYDGRSWGDFPKDKVIGRASFVFWPITERFGWGYR